MSPDIDDAYYFGPDESDLSSRSDAELQELAAGPEHWYNALALSELAVRSPALALPIAKQVLEGSDEFLIATALEVLGRLDLGAALDYMRRTAPDWTPKILYSVVEIIAVDHPIDPESEPLLLTQIAERLADPETPAELDMADLFFRRYPATEERGADPH
jgi:hypothetical protein